MPPMLAAIRKNRHELQKALTVLVAFGRVVGVVEAAYPCAMRRPAR